MSESIYPTGIAQKLHELEKAVWSLARLLEEEHIDQSTEEFVRVVRCYECRYRIQGYGWNCGYHKVETNADDYCSRGEKR